MLRRKVYASGVGGKNSERDGRLSSRVAMAVVVP